MDEDKQQTQTADSASEEVLGALPAVAAGEPLAGSTAPPPPNRDRPIGELLIESGYISQDNLDHALRVQGKLKKKKRIGRVLIELGYISDDEMRQLLEKYSRQVRLGDLLVEREFIAVADLEHALEVQKTRPNLRLGEILIKEKILTEKTFCDALAMYMNMERIIPEYKRLDWSILEKVSLKFLEQNHVLPYAIEDDQSLRVVVSEKFRRDSITTLEAIYSRKVLPGLATIDELETIIQYIRDR